MARFGEHTPCVYSVFIQCLFIGYSVLSICMEPRLLLV